VYGFATDSRLVAELSDRIPRIVSSVGLFSCIQVSFVALRYNDNNHNNTIIITRKKIVIIIIIIQK